MNHKAINKEVYDKYAQEFESKTKDYLKKYILKDAELFIANLPGKEILDLGCGSGRDSVFFKERGLNPLCFDISPEMVKLCEQKGLEAMVGDLENILFERELFDGVWAYTSLLHVPKNRIQGIFGEIHKILKPKGMFYLGMKDGNFEGLIESDKYPGDKRFFALYSDKELRDKFSPYFETIHYSEVRLGDAVFLNYLCKKI